MDNDGVNEINVGLSRVHSYGFFVGSSLAVGFCICFALLSFAADKTTGISELEHRINPNLASLPSLVRLPGIGRSRAQAIVTYRRQFRQDGRGRLAFRECNDLQKVKGIGPVTARNMCEWLKFL